MKRLFVALMLGVVPASILFAAPKKPVNVLFIAIDDMKPLMGCYGDPIAKTPNIDKLASGGMVFMNNECQWSVCGPTRASIMTSLMPEETGVMGFLKMRGNKNARLPDLVTLPQHFKNNGYVTAAVGKVNDPRCVGSIGKNGKVANDGKTVDDPPSWSLPYEQGIAKVKPTGAARASGGRKAKLAAESVDRPDADFIDGDICNKALQRLDELAKGKKPFFLAVGFKKPHLPFLAPKKYWDLYNEEEMVPAPFPKPMKNATKYTFNNIHELRNGYYLETDKEGKALPLTEGILPVAQQKHLQHGYYACASFIDALIGRLLDRLDELGLADNTIVVLWGDHGWHLGDHNEWGKHSNLEQATRAPLVIRAPGHYKGGKSYSPVEFLDIYPTLCDLASLSVPTQPIDAKTPTGRPLRGKSLRPILDDPKATIRRGAVSHFNTKGGWGYSYRTKRYRYIEWIGKNGQILANELYDYEKDPLETVNLAPNPEYKKLVAELSRSMRAPGECEGAERLKKSKPWSD